MKNRSMKEGILWTVTVFITIFVVCFTTTASAQFVINVSGGEASVQEMGDKNLKKNLVDYAYLECKYAYKMLRDTTDASRPLKEDLMVLQIGKNNSKFYSQKTVIADSMINTDGLQVLGDMAKYKGGEKFIILNDLKNGKIIYTDKIAREYFRYEESLSWSWQIEDQKKTILGYECQKATCDFRGRSYIAWFTSEIPVSQGPWKFSGLPGLIMEVYDIQNHYSFEMVGIRKVENDPIEVTQRKYLNTNRKKFLETLRKFLIDPIEYMNTYSGIKVTIASKPGEEPVGLSQRLKYDFIERD